MDDEKIKRKTSAGCVIFYGEWPDVEYLLLYRKASPGHREFWGFSRGEVEQNETELDTAKREVKEETGLNVKVLPKFKHEIQFFFKEVGKLVRKKNIFFVAESSTKQVVLSKEHDAFEWLPYDKAIDRLKFKTQKETLIKAHDFLENYFKQKRL